jgi:hypothetical protein
VNAPPGGWAGSDASDLPAVLARFTRHADELDRC